MMNPNKFNVGEKVWFKLDSYGKKAERCGTICNSILCDPISGWQYDIETGDHKHWNIPEKDINYTAPHTRECITRASNELEERVKRCRTCKYWYLTGSSEPCKSCVNSSKRNLNWEPKEKVLSVKDEFSMYPSTIASTIIKNEGESVKSFLNRIYGNPDFKPEVHSDAADSLSYSIKRKLDRIRSNAVYGLNTDLTFYDEFVNKEDNKMKNQKKRNRNIIRVKRDCPSEINEVMFNGPATIIKWEPTNDSLFYGNGKGEKTVVVCKDDEQNMTVGFLLAVVKGLVDNQSYDNILRKIDSFSSFDIPQVGKDDVFKFKVGDIVRFKHGVARFKVDRCTTFTASGGKVFPRYRIVRLLGSKCSYSAYANENELVSADEVDHK